MYVLCCPSGGRSQCPDYPCRTGGGEPETGPLPNQRERAQAASTPEAVHGCGQTQRDWSGQAQIDRDQDLTEANTVDLETRHQHVQEHCRESWRDQRPHRDCQRGTTGPTGETA
uniref:Uncharacterized protein n=1 Tax=Sphaerodactylus townsendi TaxID=933632 RepID=A0ACB8G0W5_9SAUR